MYSVFDKKTCVYGSPFLCHNNGHAVRSVQDLLSKNDLMCSKYPEDFVLYHLGCYDDKVGLLTHNDNGPKVVIECLDLARKEKNGS